MSRFTLALGWVPPFLVGLSGAVAGELSAGLLLYASPGFLPALTVVLSVLLGSLSLGLWTAPRGPKETLSESLRRRWILILVAFAGGAAVSGAWSVQGGLADDALARGLGLALLAGLPLYACGALLGAMTAGATPATTRVGASAAAGGAAGALLSGNVLVSMLFPVSLYAFCLILLSAGALLHGWLLSAQGEWRVVRAMASAYGEVGIEEWTWGRGGRVRVLLENGRIRGAEEADGLPARPWERAALELLTGWALRRPDVSWPVLVLGSGALTLPRHLLSGAPHWVVEVVERNPALIALAREELSAPLSDPRLSLHVEEPLARLGQLVGPYRAVVVDAEALASADPVPLLGRRALEGMHALLADGGVLVLGGMDRRAASGVPLETLLEEGRPAFRSDALYGLPATERRSFNARDDLMLVMAVDAAAAFPSAAGALALQAIHRAPSGTDRPHPGASLGASLEEP